MPLVSVIIPVYNAEKYIADAIQGVVGQFYSNWELIIVDDGSTDRTREVVAPFLNDDRISYSYQENSGQAHARNTAIKQASGTLLAFLDADDLWDPHKLQAQVTVIQRQNTCLVFSPIRYIDENGEQLARSIGSGTGMYHGFSALFLLACGSIAIPNSSVLVKKEHVERVGGFSENEHQCNIEDYDLWFRLLLSEHYFFGMDEVTGSYRRHKDQITHDDSGQNLKIVDYLEDLCDQYPARKMFFKFLILQRLSTYYLQHADKSRAKRICLQKYYSIGCLNTYWFDKYLIDLLKFDNFLKLRRLIIRRFRRFKTFVALINN